MDLLALTFGDDINSVVKMKKHGHRASGCCSPHKSTDSTDSNSNLSPTITNIPACHPSTPRCHMVDQIAITDIPHGMQTPGAYNANIITCEFEDVRGVEQLIFLDDIQ